MLFKSSFPTLLTLCKTPLQCFETFRNCCLFCTFWVLRNFYSGDAHHAKYGERCSNHHFRHCTNFAYHIYGILKLLEIAVCFAQFGFYEISTPVMRTVLTMVNFVQIIISDIAHSLYITLTAFLKFSKLLFVLHNLAFTKFLETSAIAHTLYITFTDFWNFSKLLFILHNLGFTKFLLQWCAPC